MPRSASVPQLAEDTATGHGPGGGVACFAAGTLIRAARGLVPVEALRVGDRVATLSEPAVAWRPIRWIGWRQVRPSQLPDPDSAWPVLIRAGAFGRGRPARDLRLSPEHAVAWEGGLIPARLLVNARTILRDRQGDQITITYYHIELDAHDLVLAEDLPVESWLDTGNRGLFANAPATSQRFTFAAEAWRDRGCRPLVTGGPRLAAARAALGSEYDAPHLVIAGHQLLPMAEGDALIFDLPPGTGWARLRSASGIPAEVQPGSHDQRRLGVAVAALEVASESGWLRLALEGLVFGRGWHAPEPGLRWTNGDGALWLAGVRRLRVHLAAAPDWPAALRLAG